MLGKRMKKRKIGKRIYIAAVSLLLTVIMVAGCGNTGGSPVSDDTEQESMDGTGILQGSLMTAVKDTQGRAEADEKSEVVMDFPAGSSFLVTGEENGWSRIYYQGKTLFVPQKDLVNTAGEDSGELDKELQNSVEEGAAFISFLERQREAEQQARIWKIIIVVLVAAVFVTGLISSLKKEKKDKTDQDSQKKEKQN